MSATCQLGFLEYRMKRGDMHKPFHVVIRSPMATYAAAGCPEEAGWEIEGLGRFCRHSRTTSDRNLAPLDSIDGLEMHITAEGAPRDHQRRSPRRRCIGNWLLRFFSGGEPYTKSRDDGPVSGRFPRTHVAVQTVPSPPAPLATQRDIT